MRFMVWVRGRPSHATPQDWALKKQNKNHIIIFFKWELHQKACYICVIIVDFCSRGCLSKWRPMVRVSGHTSPSLSTLVEIAFLCQSFVQFQRQLAQKRKKITDYFTGGDIVAICCHCLINHSQIWVIHNHSFFIFFYIADSTKTLPLKTEPDTCRDFS